MNLSKVSVVFLFVLSGVCSGQVSESDVESLSEFVSAEKQNAREMLEGVHWQGSFRKGARPYRLEVVNEYDGLDPLLNPMLYGQIGGMLLTSLMYVEDAADLFSDGVLAEIDGGNYLAFAQDPGTPAEDVQGWLNAAYNAYLMAGLLFGGSAESSGYAGVSPVHPFYDGLGYSNQAHESIEGYGPMP